MVGKATQAVWLALPSYPLTFETLTSDKKSELAS